MKARLKLNPPLAAFVLEKQLLSGRPFDATLGIVKKEFKYLDEVTEFVATLVDVSGFGTPGGDPVFDWRFANTNLDDWQRAGGKMELVWVWEHSH